MKLERPFIAAANFRLNFGVAAQNLNRHGLAAGFDNANIRIVVLQTCVALAPNSSHRQLRDGN
jgi:hypothetical protein